MLRRHALALSAAGVFSLAAPRARADFANVTLRAGTFKGQDQLILASAGLSNTPYKVEYHQFNSGQLEVEGAP